MGDGILVPMTGETIDELDEQTDAVLLRRLLPWES